MEEETRAQMLTNALHEVLDARTLDDAQRIARVALSATPGSASV